ncbi:MAG: hypothetical protein KAX38_08875 [Candidatus Krumholzibacteria bacterium]|nr:hypothetical protein [Candidatus Krumholzibacteria bacterium]
MYYTESGEFPKDGKPGKVPPEIEEYLPKDFSFNLRPKIDVRYDWEKWITKKGKPKHPKTGVIYGLSVTTKDKDIVKAITAVYQGPFHYTLGNNYNFVIMPMED